MDSSSRWVGRGRDALADGLRALRDWPWFDTLRTLRLRLRDDHLGLTASSLTFTTLISLVPLDRLLLQDQRKTQAFRRSAGLAAMTVADLLA